MPVRLGHACRLRNLHRHVAAARDVLLERRHPHGRRRLGSPASAPAAETLLACHLIQRARAIARKAAELRLADRHLARAVVGDDERQPHVLSGHDDAVVRQRVDAKAIGDDDRLLKLALLLAQPELDVEPARLVDRHASKLRAQDANGVEARQQRRDSPVVISGVEPLLRRAHLRGDRSQPVDEIFRWTRAGILRERGDGRIDAVGEQLLVAILLTGNRRFDERVRPRRRAGKREQLRHALALVHAARLSADFRVRAAEQFVVDRRVDPAQLRTAGFRRLAEPGRPVVLLRLPGPQAFSDLLGILRRIRRELRGIVRNHGRRVVMQAAVVADRGHAEDHVRPDRANQAHVVCRDLVAPPLLERLFETERVAEIDGAGEVLLGAVEAVQRGQLFRPQHAEALEDLRADLVLSAVASRRGHERRAESLPAIQHHQQAIVLIVWMRGGFHHDADVGEVTQRQAERDMPLQLVDRHDLHLGPGNNDKDDGRGKRDGKRDWESSFHCTAILWQEGREGRRGRTGSCLSCLSCPSCLSTSPGSRRNTPRTSG